MEVNRTELLTENLAGTPLEEEEPIRDAVLHQLGNASFVEAVHIFTETVREGQNRDEIFPPMRDASFVEATAITKMNARRGEAQPQEEAQLQSYDLYNEKNA